MHCRAIRWIAEGDRRAIEPRKAAVAFIEHWESQGESHLRAEETLLFPACATYSNPHGHEWLARLQADHMELRRHIRQLELQLVTGEEPWELLFWIGRALHDHIRFEERILFQEMQREMDEKALEQLGRALRSFRHAPATDHSQ